MINSTEYKRLAGIGPSLMTEAAEADPMLELLSTAFSTKVRLPDVRFIRYRKAKHGVEMEDRADRLGSILTSIEKREAEPREVIAYLKKHGAKPLEDEEEQTEATSDVGHTILQQMGGAGRLKGMIGAHTFMTHEDGLSFKFPNPKATLGNYVKVTLTSEDLYDMEFSRLVKYDAKPVKKYTGLTFEKLIPVFQKQTGLRLHL